MVLYAKGFNVHRWSYIQIKFMKYMIVWFITDQILVLYSTLVVLIVHTAGIVPNMVLVAYCGLYL